MREAEAPRIMFIRLQLTQQPHRTKRTISMTEN